MTDATTPPADADTESEIDELHLSVNARSGLGGLSLNQKRRLAEERRRRREETADSPARMEDA
jgi:hypothetical protein